MADTGSAGPRAGGPTTTPEQTGGDTTTGDRAAELRERLVAVRERLAAAEAAAGRPAGSVGLLAVTKTISAADVALLVDLGLTGFGENRVQEAGAKVDAVAELRPEARPRWHVIGGLQRNKARAAVRWADRVESVDSERLATALDGAVQRAQDAGERSGPLPVLLQLSVDGDPRRGGVPADDLLRLAEHVTACAGLRLDGLMAVAPLGADPDAAFAAVAREADRLRSAHPQAGTLSTGMSADLEVAIRHGSDVVRVGTALVGDRRITSR